MATNTSNRGFASMDEEKQREIARKGGESVPAEKRSFSKDPELASEAGRKGGQNVPDEKRSFSKDHELASEAGRKGGHASGGSFASDSRHCRFAVHPRTGQESSSRCGRFGNSWTPHRWQMLWISKRSD